jgi:hypothetical protein
MSQPLKHKMYEFEVTPPTAAWEAIATRLYDDSQYSQVSSKMSNYEAAPPPDCWNNIAASLNEVTAVKAEAEAPVIKISRKFFRYTAAAIIIGVLAGTAWLFNNNRSGKNNIAGNAGGQPSEAATGAQKKSTIESSHQQNNVGSGKTTEQPVYTANKNNAHFNIQPYNDNQSQILRYSVVTAPLSRNEGLIVIGSPPILDEKGAVIRNMDVLTTNNNYLIVAGPDGQLTRISSKFANVIRYLNSGDDVEEYLDKVIRESSVWKKRFQEWRTKISQSAFIPSSVNFLDIIEFKELIDERQ